MKKTVIKKIIRFLIRRRYLMIFSVFFVYMLIFDNNNFISFYRLNSQIKALEKQKVQLIEKIRQDSIRLSQLKTDDKTFERFARETYFFHKPNEEVFIIKEKK